MRFNEKFFANFFVFVFCFCFFFFEFAFVRTPPFSCINILCATRPPDERQQITEAMLNQKLRHATTTIAIESFCVLSVKLWQIFKIARGGTASGVVPGWGLRTGTIFKNF
jgi:hypothetical protein